MKVMNCPAKLLKMPHKSEPRTEFGLIVRHGIERAGPIANIQSIFSVPTSIEGQWYIFWGRTPYSCSHQVLSESLICTYCYVVTLYMCSQNQSEFRFNDFEWVLERECLRCLGLLNLLTTEAIMQSYIFSSLEKIQNQALRHFTVA